MGLSFLADYGAQRAGRDEDGPDLFGNETMSIENEASETSIVDLDYEIIASDWRPLDVSKSVPPPDWQGRPRRYVDGKDVGRTIAWLRSPDGSPVPVRLAQVGGVALQAVPSEVGLQLRAEYRRVEKIVALMADLFPWNEVESFTAALAAHGFRLLIVPPVAQGENEKPNAHFDFEGLRVAAKVQTINAMLRIEREALSNSRCLPTVVDGRLQEKAGAFASDDPVIGVIKTHRDIPLHKEGFRVLQSLRPFQRTPVYRRLVKQKDRNGSTNAAIEYRFLTWFLRLGALGGETPLQGAVRVEINSDFFEKTLNTDYSYIDLLSNELCRCRTHDTDYRRAAITLHPIQRAEDVLRSHFMDMEIATRRFYRLTGL